MKTKYRGLHLKEIIAQLSIDQFTRLCNAVDKKYGKLTRFDILAVKPYRNNKDESLIVINVLLKTHRVESFEIAEKI